MNCFFAFFKNLTPAPSPKERGETPSPLGRAGEGLQKYKELIHNYLNESTPKSILGKHLNNLDAQDQHRTTFFYFEG